MGTMAFQNTSPTIASLTADQRKHQRSVSLAYVKEFTSDRRIPRTKVR